MPGILLISFCLMVSTGEASLVSQESMRSEPPYRLVVEKLQQELDRASAGGYAVALAWPAYDLAILRQRLATEHSESYQVLNGKKAIEQGLAGGYRAVPDTLDVKGGALMLVAMKAPADEHYETLLVQTNRTSTLDREIQDGRTKGFYVVGMASDDSGHAALLERRSGPSGSAVAPAIALIAANRQDTLQKELTARATAGYRLVRASSWKEMVLVLEQRDANGNAPVDYRILSTSKSSTLEREMNAAASNGFRLRPGTLHAIQKGSVMGLPASGYEYLAIMEKASGAEPPPGYGYIGAKRMGTLAREFDDAVARGWVPVDMTLGYSSQETVVVFERPR